MVDKKLTIREIQAYQKARIEFIQKMVAELGNIFELQMLWIKVLVINEPDLVRELLVKRVNQVHRDPFSGRALKRILGEGVLVAENQTWRRKRKFVQPAFHATRIQEYTAVMAKYTQEMVAQWQTGNELAIDEQFAQLTLRIIAKTMYNVDLISQVEAVGKNMAILAETGETQLGKPYILPKWVPTALNRRQNQATDAIHTLLRGIIKERRASGRDEGDLLSMLMQMRDEEDASSLNEEELLDECKTLFFAGHETTAALMTWTWYLLGQNKAVKEKLRAEVEAALGGDLVSFEDLSQLPYTEWVIKEAMRLYPPAWTIGRVAVEDFKLGERPVTKGTILLASPYLLQRSAQLFPNPEQFWPERWADDQPQPDRYAYIPFGAGPRVCLGNMFAMLEARVILTTMVQLIDLELLSGKVEMDLRLTLRPKGQLLMKVQDRDKRPLINSEHNPAPLSPAFNSDTLADV